MREGAKETSGISRLVEDISRWVVRLLVVSAAALVALVLAKSYYLDEPVVPRSFAERLLIDAREAVAADPRSSEARAVLARAYVLIGRYQDAIEEASAGLAIAPADPANHLYLGLAYKKLGLNSQAIRHLEQASKAKGMLAEFYFQAYMELAGVYEAENRYPQAVYCYEKAIRNDLNGSVDVLRNLAKAYEKTGEKEKAVATYEWALRLLPGDDQARKALERLRGAGK